MFFISYILVFPKNTAKLEQRIRALLAVKGIRLRQCTHLFDKEETSNLLAAWKLQPLYTTSLSQVYIAWEHSMLPQNTENLLHSWIDAHTKLKVHEQMTRVCQQFGGEFVGAFITEDPHTPPYFLSKEMCTQITQVPVYNIAPHIQFQQPSTQLVNTLEALPYKLSLLLQSVHEKERGNFDAVAPVGANKHCKIQKHLMV